MLQRLSTIQGFYFLATGLWPLVAPGSFAWVSAITEPAWRFESIGLLIAAIGVVLLEGRARPTRTLKTLGLATSLALIAIDARLMWGGVIGAVNLGDVILQAVCVLGWLAFKI